MATKVQGVYLRGGVFWLHVIAPKDLQAAFYGGKKIAHNASLRTSDPQVARVSATTTRADLEAQFLRQRWELSPPKMASVTPELRRYIMDALLAQEVATDAAQRMDKTKTHSVYGGITVAYELADGSLPERSPVPSVSPLHPNAPHVVTARTAFNLKRMETVRAALASGAGKKRLNGAATLQEYRAVLCYMQERSERGIGAKPRRGAHLNVLNLPSRRLVNKDRENIRAL